MRWMFFMPVAIALVVSLILGPIVIPLLRKMKFGQTEREDGVQSHLKKAGTPTMGGIIILGGIVFASLFYVKDYPRILPILFVTLGFGFIGFLDDYLKVVKKHPDGLLPKQKMALQLIVTAAFAFYLVKYSQVALTMFVPFSGGYQLNVGWLAIPILFIATIGTVNGTNFTDGLDGLASSVTVVVAIFFRLASMDMQSGIEPIIGATIGALAGFLFFNSHPASVFMGDTGSLVLGIFLAATAIYFSNSVEVANLFFISPPVMMLSLFIVPVTDTLRVFFIRVRDNRSPFSPDMNHFHHLLIRSGMTHVQGTCFLIAYTMLFMLLAYLFSYLKMEITISFFLILALSFVAIFSIAAISNRKSNKGEGTQ